MIAEIISRAVGNGCKDGLEWLRKQAMVSLAIL